MPTDLEPGIIVIHFGIMGLRCNALSLLWARISRASSGIQLLIGLLPAFSFFRQRVLSECTAVHISKPRQVSTPLLVLVVFGPLCVSSCSFG